MIRTTSIGLALGLTVSLLSACAAVVTPQELNRPLQMALEVPVEEIRQGAEEGDRPSQYALSFLMKYGLRGVERDPVAAEGLRASAGRSLTTVQAIYVPPTTKGGSGSVMNVSSASPGISDTEARRLDMCGATLFLAQPAMGGQVCGSPEAYATLLTAAVEVRGAGLGLGRPRIEYVRDPIAPETITSCDDTPPLWDEAVGFMMAENEADAIKASDRIIALCGETPASWDARLMRAALHVQAKDYQPVAALMAPVPIPAPGMSGGYSGVVPMVAAQHLQDWEAHARNRDRLSKTSIEALSLETGTKLEARFAFRGDQISLFRREAESLPGLGQIYVAVMERGDPQALLFGYAVTHHIGNSPVTGYFLDEYSCAGRNTLYHFDEAPTPEQVRQKLEERLGGKLEPLSGTSVQGLGNLCLWPSQIAPGLGNDPVVQRREVAKSASGDGLEGF